MKNKTAISCILLLICSISCTKENSVINDRALTKSIIKDFWRYSGPSVVEMAGTSSTSKTSRALIVTAVKDLRTMGNSDNFENQISNIGKPEWDFHLELLDVRSTPTLIVPIVNYKNKDVPAVIVINYLDNNKYFKYNVIRRGNYPKATGKNFDKNLTPAPMWNAIFSGFDKDIFDTGNSSGFLIKDATGSKPKKSSTSTKGWWYITTGTCVYTYVPADPSVPGYSSCDFTYDLVWFPDDYNPNGAEDPTGGGMSGGGNTGPVSNANYNTIFNKIDDPCLRGILTSVINSGVRNEISQIVSTLHSNTQIEVSFHDEFSTSNGAPANINNATYDPNSKIFTADLTISTDLLANGTQEYATAVIIHEIVHAFYSYTANADLLNTKSHEDMASEYADPLIRFLVGHHGMAIPDAMSLTWIGLSSTNAYQGRSDFYHSSESITKSQIESTYVDYLTKTRGTPLRTSQGGCN